MPDVYKRQVEIRGSLSSWLPIVRFLIFAIIVLLFIYVMIIVVGGRVAGLGAVGIHGGKMCIRDRVHGDRLPWPASCAHSLSAESR